MSGATPRGAANEQEAAAWVRDMFGRVAPRYDLLNHLLSFNIDKHWRNRTVKRLQPVLDRPDAQVLDLCCGTGDLMLAIRAKATGKVFGSDFCHPMLTAAKQKAGASRRFLKRTPSSSASRWIARCDYGRLRLSQSGELRERTAGIEARLEDQRSRGDSRIFTAAQPVFNAAYGSTRETSCRAIGGADLRGVRCLHLPARLRQEVPGCPRSRR